MLVIALSLLILSACGNSQKEDDYNQAVSLLESGDLTNAFEAFSALGDYKDSYEKACNFIVMPTSFGPEGKDPDTVFTYDKQGRLVSAKDISFETLIDEYIIEYDDAGLKTMDHYHEDSELGRRDHWEHFVFDGNKPIVVDVNHYNNSGLVRKDVAKIILDEQGFPTELREDDEFHVTKYRCEYGENGELISVQNYEYNGENVEDNFAPIVYTYDEYGNYTGCYKEDAPSSYIYNSEVVGIDDNMQEIIHDNVLLLLFIDKGVPLIN